MPNLIFQGGYNTLRHGSIDAGAIDGIQVECNSSIRFDEVIRHEFADSITQSIIDYIGVHYYDQFEEDFCNLLSNNKNLFLESYLNLYPNPATDQLQIESNLKEMDILIYNSLGQQIDFIKWNGSSLDINHLEKGLHFLVFRNNGFLITTRLLVKQ